MTSASRRSAKDRALDLLAYRSRSRREIADRLRQAGYEEVEVEDALADLEAVGLVDDERFARELAAYQMGPRGGGPRLAMNALYKARIDRGLAERIVEELTPDDEDSRAEDVARDRLRRLSNLDEPTAYRRLVSFLLRRGYESDTARTAARKALEGAEGPSA